VGTSQTSVRPVQSVVLVAEQWPHAPLVSQAGVLPLHSLSAAQARQVWVPESQAGVVPPQLALETQATQTRGEAVVRQYGVAPLQSASLAQPSMMIGVGGAPGPPPLPSDR